MLESRQEPTKHNFSDPVSRAEHESEVSFRSFWWFCMTSGVESEGKDECVRVSGRRQNLRSRFFVDVYIWIDAVFYGLSENKIESVGDYCFDVLLTQTLTKVAPAEDQSIPMQKISYTENASSTSYFYIIIVEELLLYRLVQTAPRTDELVLRKVKNTKNIEFLTKMRVFQEACSLFCS